MRTSRPSSAAAARRRNTCGCSGLSRLHFPGPGSSAGPCHTYLCFLSGPHHKAPAAGPLRSPSTTTVGRADMLSKKWFMFSPLKSNSFQRSSAEGCDSSFAPLPGHRGGFNRVLLRADSRTSLWCPSCVCVLRNGPGVLYSSAV